MYDVIDDPKITRLMKTQQSFRQSEWTDWVVGPEPQLFPYLSGFDCELHIWKSYRGE